MELFQVDDDGRLFISPALEEWDAASRCDIDTVIDLEGDIDTCIPTLTNHCLYIYFPIDDDNETLPNMVKLRAIARLAASLIADGHRVLSHCGMGYNRSAFMAGLILGGSACRAPGRRGGCASAGRARSSTMAAACLKRCVHRRRCPAEAVGDRPMRPDQPAVRSARQCADSRGRGRPRRSAEERRRQSHAVQQQRQV